LGHPGKVTKVTPGCSNRVEGLGANGGTGGVRTGAWKKNRYLRKELEVVNHILNMIKNQRVTYKS